jgi:hypothetical protein
LCRAAGFIMRQNTRCRRGHAAPRQSRIESRRIGAQLPYVVHNGDP